MAMFNFFTASVVGFALSVGAASAAPEEFGTITPVAATVSAVEAKSFRLVIGTCMRFSVDCVLYIHLNRYSPATHQDCRGDFLRLSTCHRPPGRSRALFRPAARTAAIAA